ncbi:abortive infection family protein [Kordiimonas sp. SCSIO 12610]|uniref:abortive infection family protein n=1 Tax=Kordiimonas sp. SCSIO 12610 TaxID=2829597 RepID=UPI002109D792|nr:abortive infection family protein [Kordiimonas sp. SCSIO 12610]UTW54473.1 abortive infection family protein [Kordiimonas sp. SCSIO 12610]
MKITPITRRDLFDVMIVEQVNWSGSLDETEFLSRLYNLKQIPSTDYRYSDAEGDIFQHRVNNSDWEDHWIFNDRRFALMNGDDEILLKFLAETVHPVVRPDVTSSQKLVTIYNNILINDGFEIAERARISGKPIYIGRNIGTSTIPALSAAKDTLSATDLVYVTQQITRMEAAVHNDPSLAIGTAKELIESCCKTILQEREINLGNGDDLPKLVKTTVRELKLTPNDIPDATKAADSIRKLLSNLATVAYGIAELRNKYGTGHGKAGQTRGLTSRHAKLAVGAASTLSVFLVETHRDQNNN